MYNQFGSCSYDELTSCVKARVKWIREARLFLGDPLTIKYQHVRGKIRLSVLTNKLEIRSLLVMRRVLKTSPYKAWDDDNAYLRLGLEHARVKAERARLYGWADIREEGGGEKLD